jgi:hypothetical protein
MKKIPTIFDRDWDGDRSLVTRVPHSDCGWVFAGEGRATIKLDGSCCMIRGGRLYKRRELKGGTIPDGFELVGYDEETKKSVGWMPVGEGPEDQYHREAWGREVGIPADGTYELVGPKVQGGAESWSYHTLIPHGAIRPIEREEPPRDFDGLKAWFTGQDIEGLVYHHPDGRMAKIKLKDFGIKRRGK